MRATPRLRDDTGDAMVMVILLGAVLVLLTSVITTRGSATLNRVSEHRRWEVSLHVSESGVEHMLAELSASAAHTTGEIVPTFADDDAERAWVLEKAADHAPVQAREGEWVALRPSNAQVIYAVGYVPSRAEAEKTRVVRAEYDFAPFTPLAAILTDDDLSIAGNPSVTGTNGSAHGNGDVDLNGNPSFSRYVSASGSYTSTGTPVIGDPANSGGGKPIQHVPAMNPLDYYDLVEYVLCPDGHVRAGPLHATPGSSAPATECAGGASLADANTDRYRGWRKTGDDSSQGAKWDYSGNTAYDGVYFVHHGSASVSGSPGSSSDPWEVTLLASASASGIEPHCPHTGGDISLTGNPKVRYHPDAQPLLLLAGRDLKVAGNPSAGDKTYVGLLAAHEQFEIMGNPRIDGAIVAESVCNSAGSPVNATSSKIPGNTTIHYDGDLSFPSGDGIRITLWLELF